MRYITFGYNTISGNALHQERFYYDKKTGNIYCEIRDNHGKTNTVNVPLLAMLIVSIYALAIIFSKLWEVNVPQQIVLFSLPLMHLIGIYSGFLCVKKGEKNRTESYADEITVEELMDRLDISRVKNYATVGKRLICFFMLIDVMLIYQSFVLESKMSVIAMLLSILVCFLITLFWCGNNPFLIVRKYRDLTQWV